ncbi:MAG TPA: EamA family transporter [Terriglobus sp.]
MKQQKTTIAVKRIAAYAAVYLLWGGVYLVIRVLVVRLPPFFTAAARYSLGALCLLLVSFWRREALPNRRQTMDAAWTGVMMLAVGFGVVFWAERQLASWVVAVMASTSTVWTYLGETLLVRSRQFDGRLLTVLVAGLGGVVLCAGITSARGAGAWLAPAIVLLGAMCWAAGSLSVKHLDMPPSYIQSAMIQLGASGLMLMAVSFLSGEWKQIPPWHELVTTRLLGAMAYLVVAASVLAFTAYHWLLQREPASMVATCTYVNPVVAMLLGIVVAGEAFSTEQLLGTAVILISVFTTWRLHAGAGSAVIEPAPAMQE